MTGVQTFGMHDCEFESDFVGDSLCLGPPAADEGFQVYLGPEDHGAPEPHFILEPGEERNDFFELVSDNPEDIYFFQRQYRMRPGGHHMILVEQNDLVPGGVVGFVAGRRLATSQNSVRDVPPAGVVAPENEGLAYPLRARRPLILNLHYFNPSDRPMLIEVWLNFYYVPAEAVVREVRDIFLYGSIDFAVPPGVATTLGPYRCTATGPFRLLEMFGHRHAHAPRFSAYRIRGDVREQIYDSLDWREPAFLHFDSITQNPIAAPDHSVDGGHSGPLELQTGDALEWECPVINDSDGVLEFSDSALGGEMCVIIGSAIGAPLHCSP